MRLKELISRSGGVITAIALLGSMMTMAGAAPDPGADAIANCSICSSSFWMGFDWDGSSKTYQ